MTPCGVSTGIPPAALQMDIDDLRKEDVHAEEASADNRQQADLQDKEHLSLAD